MRVGAGIAKEIVRRIGATVKPPTLSSHLRRPLKRLFKKADRGPRDRGGRAFRPPREFLLRAKNSLRVPCPGKKIPCFSAYPLKEFCRKDLKSKVFSTRIFAKKAELAANWLRAGNFSPYPASKSRSASANSTDPISSSPRQVWRPPPTRGG
jgi:hypothetical protein